MHLQVSIFNVTVSKNLTLISLWELRLSLRQIANRSNAKGYLSLLNYFIDISTTFMTTKSETVIKKNMKKLIFTKKFLRDKMVTHYWGNFFLWNHKFLLQMVSPYLCYVDDNEILFIVAGFLKKKLAVNFTTWTLSIWMS